MLNSFFTIVVNPCFIKKVTNIVHPPFHAVPNDQIGKCGPIRNATISLNLCPNVICLAYIAHFIEGISHE